MKIIVKKLIDGFNHPSPGESISEVEIAMVEIMLRKIKQ